MPEASADALAAARAARGDVRVPRVAGEPAQRGVGVDPQPEVGQVRAPDRDRARRAQALDHRRVERRRRPRPAPATPDVVGVPATSMFSLTVTGTPCSAPSAASASAASAAARASSPSTSVIALRWPLTASIRSRCASTTSREETSRVAISSASSPAPRRHRSSNGSPPARSQLAVVAARCATAMTFSWARECAVIPIA